MTIKTNAQLLGALATAALMLAPAPALAAPAHDRPAPPPPAPAGGKRTGPLALAPVKLRLRADRLDAGYGLAVL
jgi:hypothetical protein